MRYKDTNKIIMDYKIADLKIDKLRIEALRFESLSDRACVLKIRELQVADW
jgi:hypothetical protein